MSTVAWPGVQGSAFISYLGSLPFFLGTRLLVLLGKAKLRGLECFFMWPPESNLMAVKIFFGELLCSFTRLSTLLQTAQPLAPGSAVGLEIQPSLLGLRLVFYVATRMI